MTLLKEKHPHRDFFAPDIFETLGASFKDDIASMGYPIFTLSKKKDMRNLEYKNGYITITIKPNTDGLPTIFDKDVLLYCMSLMMTEINAGRTPQKTLRISCRDLLITTNRRTDGDDYDRLKKSLDRLTGVVIKTNIKTNRYEQTSAFGILESYNVIESSKIKNRMIRLEITVSDWLYNSVIGKEVLTINRDYFRLGKPIERRIYEIVRKYCGKSKQWEIALEKLISKVGSSDTLRRFRLRLKEIALHDHLPDYSIAVSNDDKVIFTQKSLSDNIKPKYPIIDYNIGDDISGKTIMQAKNMIDNAALNFNDIIQQWTIHMKKHGTPNNINGALMGFIKSKIKNE